MKILYVTDLDGTLLQSDQTLSDYSARALSKLIENGVLFSYATARSAKTAGAVMKGIDSKMAAVVYNGAFVIDTKSGERLISNAFPTDDSRLLIDKVLSMKIFPRVYSLIEGEERFTYTKEHLESEAAREYFRTRTNDSRARLGDYSMLYEGEIFLISCCGKREELIGLYERVKDSCQCHFYKDNYSDDHYLELVPRGATKENGVKKLKELYGCDKIIAFGDGVNDITLFKCADKCYAVSNACDELKAIATGIIGSNDEDSVVKWIENAQKIT